jgi:ABC-type transport system involved in multi-copper enzyme maturation permease subunit
VLVGLLFFAALLITYLAAFPRDVDLLARINPSEIQKRLSQFGQDFALTFLLVQAAIVLLLTPLFVVGAVVEETERRTLEFLLATDLSAREIVLGKLWPRCLLMVGIVLAGWPVLAATQVWGGVDVVFVGLASIVVVTSIWAVAGISAACAVGAPSLRKGLVKSYLWLVLCVGLPIFTCPCGVISALSSAQVELARAQANQSTNPNAVAAVLVPMVLFFSLHLVALFVIGVLGVRRACFKLRHARHFYARMPWQQRPRNPAKWEQHPPVPQGSPLLWKEIYLSGQTARLVRMLNLVPWVVWLCVSSVFMLVGLVFLLDATNTHDVLTSMNGLVRWAGGLLLGLMCLIVGLHAAGSVARERQQGTIVDLLAVPRPRSEILWAKWVGSLAKARGIAVGAMAVPLVGVLAEGISFWAVLPLVAAAFVFVACAASFGLWLSVRFKSIQRASGMWMLAVGLWVGGTFLAAQAAYLEERSARRFTTAAWPPKEAAPLIWDRALNPVMAWSQLTFRFPQENELPDYYREARDGRIESAEILLPSVLGVVLYGFLAWLFFRLAAWKFEREGQG